MRILLFSVAFALNSWSTPVCAQISAEAASSSVRRFIGDANAGCVVAGPHKDVGWGQLDPYFRVEVTTPPHAGTFYVDAASGRLMSMGLHYIGSSDPVRVTPEAARQIGERFLGANWPEFLRRKWRFECLFNEPFPPGRYELIWNQVLSESGALAPWNLTVGIDAASGRVVIYRAVPDQEIQCPVTPNISLAQAKNIAAAHARYPLQRSPFVESRLHVIEDRNRVQWLLWHLRQYDTPDIAFGVYIDSMSGEVLGTEFPLGMGPNSPLGPAGGRPAPRILLARSHAAAAQPLASSVPPEVRGSRMWIRAEMLRAAGAEVETTNEELSVSASGRRFTSSQLNARKGEWWIPLAPTLRLLGWEVSWVNRTKTAVLTVPSTANASRN